MQSQDNYQVVVDTLDRVKRAAARVRQGGGTASIADFVGHTAEAVELVLRPEMLAGLFVSAIKVLWKEEEEEKAKEEQKHQGKRHLCFDDNIRYAFAKKELMVTAVYRNGPYRTGVLFSAADGGYWSVQSNPSPTLSREDAENWMLKDLVDVQLTRFLEQLKTSPDVGEKKAQETPPNNTKHKRGVKK